MKRVKPKFRALWNKMLFRRPNDEPLCPFPGSSLLRWAVIDDVIGTLRYEGKPSTQALRIAASQEHRGYLVEFDKKGPIVCFTVYPDKSFKVGPVDWQTWRRYHGEKSFEDNYAKIFKGEAGAGI